MDRAIHRLDDAREGRHDTVTGGIDDAALMIANVLAKDIAADIEHVHGRPLVVAH